LPAVAVAVAVTVPVVVFIPPPEILVKTAATAHTALIVTAAVA
jgi:hypothetical protein